MGMFKIMGWLALALLSSGGLTAYFLQQQYEEKITGIEANIKRLPLIDHGEFFPGLSKIGVAR